MIESYKNFWKNYFNFKGREDNIVFWKTMLIHFVFAVISYLVSFVIAKVVGLDVVEKNTVALMLALLPYMIYLLATFIPTLSICVRRLHDTNKSGWYMLLGLIPILGGIIILILMSIPTVSENNKY